MRAFETAREVGSRNPTWGIFSADCAATAELGARSMEHKAKRMIFLVIAVRPTLLISALSSILFAPCYLMTRSARASTFGGIASPICFAAFKLITNSNVVGRSTGISMGFVPLSILSTITAERKARLAVRAIGHLAVALDEFSPRINRWQLMFCRQLVDAALVGVDQRA